ncbi:hypothetical protein Hanom_Chr17g01581511 [Helianthus anomalus]
MQDDVNQYVFGSEGEQVDYDTLGIFTDVEHVTFVPTSQKTIYLFHDVEEGEFVHIYAKEDIAKMGGVDEKSFEFDVFNKIPDADEYDEAIVEDDSDSEPVRHSSENTYDFPTFSEMFAHEAYDVVLRRIEERVKDGDSPRIDQEKIRDARLIGFKLMLAECKFKRPLAFFTRN